MYPSVYSYLECRPDGDDGNANAVGGRVIRTTAAAALNVGDAVYWSASGKVNKSTTAANYAGFAGIVVGGKSTGMRVPDNTNVASQAATTADGDDVLVQIDGIAYVVAAGTVTIGTHFTVMPDTSTAGRVAAGTTAGQVIGKAITTGAAAAWMKIQIFHR